MFRTSSFCSEGDEYNYKHTTMFDFLMTSGTFIMTCRKQK